MVKLRLGTRWLGDREVGWRRVRSAPCTWRRGARVSCLSLKTKVGFLGWASKLRSTVSRFGPQNRQLWFGDLGLKITASASWFEPQNQTDYNLLVTPQNRGEDDSARGTRRDLAACFAWNQVTLGFLSVTSRLAVAQWRVVHVTSSRRMYWVEAEDRRVDATGCIRLFYPNFIIFYIRP
jgi:hypothetical protein